MSNPPTPRKPGRPKLPESERRVWIGMRISPAADRRLCHLCKWKKTGAGNIVSQILEGQLTVLPLNK